MHSFHHLAQLGGTGRLGHQDPDPYLDCGRDAGPGEQEDRRDDQHDNQDESYTPKAFTLLASANVGLFNGKLSDEMLDREMCDTLPRASLRMDNAAEAGHPDYPTFPNSPCGWISLHAP